MWTAPNHGNPHKITTIMQLFQTFPWANMARIKPVNSIDANVLSFACKFPTQKMSTSVFQNNTASLYDDIKNQQYFLKIVRESFIVTYMK